MGSTIMQPKLSGYQANHEDNSFASNQPIVGKEEKLSQSFSADSLKHIIHDLNHHLMLIGLSADNLAGYSQHDNHACENARILRRNLDQVASILANLFANDDKHEVCALGWAQLDLLLQRQKYDWQLLAGEDIALTIIVEPFENSLYVELMALMRVLTNFVHNGVDALRDKQHSQNKEQTLTMTITCQGIDDDTLFIHIKDNGNGIKDELRESLFTAGHSSKNTAKNNERGYGLSSVQAQLARWAGEAQLVASSRELGSHFVLSLPLQSQNKLK